MHGMNIRPAKPSDLDAVREIDSVIESTHYLHVDRDAGDASLSFRLERRPLREKLIAPNPMDDDSAFTLKQIVSGMDEGIAMVAEHDGQVVALLLAQTRHASGTLDVLDLRVDYDYRRQGVATVLLFQLIEKAKELELRAVHATTLTNNDPAAALMRKLGFELSGIDLRRRTNHDLVKESATLMWYYESD